jgi:hypothetical protein
MPKQLLKKQLEASLGYSRVGLGGRVPLKMKERKRQRLQAAFKS